MCFHVSRDTGVCVLWMTLHVVRFIMKSTRFQVVCVFFLLSNTSHMIFFFFQIAFENLKHLKINYQCLYVYIDTFK